MLLLALLLRLARLGYQPLWADEGYSVYFASLDPIALARATAADIHPPLYYYLLKLWGMVLGPGDVSLRLFSVFCGLLTVAVVYRLGCAVSGRRVGLLAAAALAVSPFHVFYSQEVRMYALAALLAACSTFFMLRLLAAWENDKNGGTAGRRAWLTASAPYVLATALGLYTLYYAAFIPLAQTVYVLWICRRRVLVLRWLALLAGVGVLYLPWIYTALDALAAYVAGKVAVESYAVLNPLAFVAQVGAALGAGVPSTERSYLALGALPVVALAVIALMRPGSGGSTADTEARPRLLLMASLVVAPLVAGYVVNLLWPFNPLGFQRLFLPALPFFAVLVAGGVVHLLSQPGRTKTAAALAAAGVLVAAAILADFYVTPRHGEHDYRTLVRAMAELAHPDDVVVALYPWQAGFVRTYFVGRAPTVHVVERPKAWADDGALMQRELAALGERHGRIWFPAYEGAGGLLEAAINAYLTNAAFPGKNTWYGKHRLTLYAWGEAGALLFPKPKLIGALRLHSVRASLDPQPVGQGSVRVEFRWLANDGLPARGQVILRLVDDADRVWAIRSSAPRNGSLPFAQWQAETTVIDRHALPIPAATPPGSYRLMLRIYDEETGRNTPLARAPDGQPGTEVELANIILTRGTYYPPPRALGLPPMPPVRFRGGPTLIAAQFAALPLRAGHTVALDLYWTVPHRATADAMLFVQARDRANKVWGIYEGPASGMQYPLARWGVGETVRSQVLFLLPPDAPAGEYGIYAGWLVGSSKERLTVAGGADEALLGRVQVLTRPRNMTLPQPQRPLNVRLGDAVQLLGYDLSSDTPVAGATVDVTLYWRSLARIGAPYTIFVHLVDAQSAVRAQHDGEPVSGSVPTTSWLPGEVIADRHTLILPANLPGGAYVLFAGLYDSGSLVRIPVRGPTREQGDAVELGLVTVVR